MGNTIHVINLSTDQPAKTISKHLVEKSLRNREERALSIVRQSKEQKFAVQFWPGIIVENQPRYRNIVQAFKKIVQFAQDSRMLRVTIAEDDCVFTAPNALQYYLDNMPPVFDTYLGGVYSGTLKFADSKKSLYYIQTGYSGHTLITIHRRFYDKILSFDESFHLDQWLGRFAHQHLYYVCRPFVVRQMTPTYSENHHKEILSYEAYEEKWEYLK